MNTDEFFQQHAIEGALTPEQAAQLLELSAQGDTGAKPEQGSQPEPPASDGKGASQGELSSELNKSNPDDAQTKAEGAEVAPSKQEETAKPVILAKDGVHTIDYQKLVDAREGEKYWKAQAESAQRQLADLQAQAQARVDAGQAPTKTDNQVAAAQAAIDSGVDPQVFGDFSEEALAKGIQTIIDAKIAAKTGEIEASFAEKVGKVVAPIQQKQAEDATTAHYAAIYAKHPDADSIVESADLDTWINGQPSFVRDGFRSVLNKGSAAEVIELFDRFKEDTGKTQAATPAVPSKETAKAAAKEAIAKAAVPIPNSLSDIPGSGAGTSAEDAMEGMSGPQLLAEMERRNWTPAQIDNYLNRRL